MSDNQPAVVVKELYKSFKLPHDQHSGIKQLIVNFAKRKKGYEVQHVLDDVSFEIKKGEFFGIVGRNGSGKSTLLKLLAGIYVPDKGLVQVKGSLTPFIELGVGFNPELTGRENVFLNGALLGFSRQEMEEMYDDIVSFAELERFMDQKLKNYSSGMQVRLAFSIAIRAESDVLLIDEVLAVGDAAFQQKCYDYFDLLKQQKRTIILVTHDMSAVKRFCTKAVLIEQGQVKIIGSPDDIANQYTLDNLQAENKHPSDSNKKIGGSVSALNINLVSEPQITNQEELVFEVEYELNEPQPVEVGISILTQGISILEQRTDGLRAPSNKKKTTLRYSLPLDSFNPGRYRIDVALFEQEELKLQSYNTDAANFLIKETTGSKGGILAIQGKWEVLE